MNNSIEEMICRIGDLFNDIDVDSDLENDILLLLVCNDVSELKFMVDELIGKLENQIINMGSDEHRLLHILRELVVSINALYINV